MPPRIVLDTNCILNAYLSPGYSREVLLLAQKKKIIIVTSRILLAEFSEVSRKKIQDNQSKLNHFRNKLFSLIEIIEPKNSIAMIKRDPDDNRVLEAAVEGKCDFIVTGDRDLLELKVYQGIKILNPKDFLERIILH